MRNQGIMWTSIGVLITILGTVVIDGWTGTVVAAVGTLVTLSGAVLVFRSQRKGQSDE